jgi:hypothetical protein
LRLKQARTDLKQSAKTAGGSDSIAALPPHLTGVPAKSPAKTMAHLFGITLAS